MSRRLRFVIVLWLAAALPAVADPDVGRVARVVVAGINHAREEAGAKPVVPDAKLVRAAQAFADYLARTDRFDHDADGSTPMERARKAGYAWCKISENIAYEWNTRGFESDVLAQAFVRDWKESRGHRRNLLDAEVVETGVGVAQSRKTHRWYAVQMFGRPRGPGGCR